MSDSRNGTFSPEEHLDCCKRNDGRTDFEWRSECGWLGLLRVGEGFVICCGGFYNPWFGDLQGGIDFLKTFEAEGED